MKVINNKTYKYLVAVLVVIVFALLSILSTAWGGRVIDLRRGASGVSSDLAGCQRDIESWRAKYATTATLTDAAKTELSAVLKACNDKAAAGTEALR